MQRKIKYAVVGQGYFAQAAVLPAFKTAENSELTALFSGDAEKRKELKRRYDVEHALGYEEYDGFLQSGAVDAVYIAVPNSEHCEYTVRAARAGVHVLCEKPMALTEQECERMIDACKTAGVKLMVAYRLHFEEANLTAVEIVKSGQIGEPRLFTSTFSMQVQQGNIRLKAELGGGPLYDIGIYCINAARYILRQEPIEVSAFFSTRLQDPRFMEVEEQVGALLRFPGDKLGSLVVSFGASDVSRYEVVCTRGRLVVSPAFDYAEPLRHELTIDGKTRTRTFKKRDQVAPEIVYFSDCILQDREPEPSGAEGLADVRVMRALNQSAGSSKAVALEPNERVMRPDLDQEQQLPAHGMPKLVKAHPPSAAE